MAELKEHLTYGKMVALAVAGNKLDDHPEIKQHFHRCDRCRGYFGSLGELLNRPGQEIFDEVREYIDRNTRGCSGDFMKLAAVLILFMRNQLSESQALELISHLNSCYSCFESLSRNWNDYLQMSSSHDT